MEHEYLEDLKFVSACSHTRAGICRIKKRFCKKKHKKWELKLTQTKQNRAGETK